MDFQRIKNSRVLVTGGAGFIGSNLCEDLLKFDNEVVCLDNFSTGKHENLKEFASHKNFRLITGDIRNIEDCKKSLDGIDTVLHQAALGSVPRSFNDPISTNSVNIGGFLNILVTAREAKVKRVVYAASSSTYGDSSELPKIEDLVCKPSSPYAITKYVNELYAQVFAKNFNLDIVGLRYFNVFGRRQDANGAYAAVIPKFTIQLMSHESPVINGDGTISRDFTYIDNIIQINHLAATSTNPNLRGQVFNAAVGERNDINMLANYLKMFLSRFDEKINDVNLIHGSQRMGDILHSIASIEKAKTMLNYCPQFNFKKGLEIASEWYWNNLK